jgi:hypothetical protein
VTRLSALRSSARARWLGTFALVAAVVGLWAVATPVFASADENAHVTRAAAVARGELTGETVPDREGFVSVSLPEAYAFGSMQAGCFAGRANEDASCFRFEGSETEARPVLTDAGRHPPAYYAVVGVVSRVMPTAESTVWVMRVATVLITAVFVTIAIGALSRTPVPRLALLGLVVALTPMVLAFGGVVNPSAPEVAAALATWACGLTLVAELRRGAAPDRGLVTQLGVSAAVLVLSRQISMFWLALIALIFAGLLGRDAIRRLWQATVARVCAAVVGACALAQLGWILLADGLELSVLPNADPDRPAGEIVRRSVGRSSRLFLEMVGWPGWLDTRLPSLSYWLVIAALGALVVAAITLGSRRYVVAMLAAAAGTVVVPIVLEAWQARDYGFYWQGRYTLPFAVGVPLLAVFALQPGPGERVALPNRFVVAVGGMTVGAQLVAFYQALRRWSVGADGSVLYWLDPGWNAPLPQWLLLALYVVVLTGFVAWLLAPPPPSRLAS